ncbi:MAG TPA: hemerythrin domain-containing protein [Polyangiaceae bacterium]|nr:hemerythrin domain-containing protein [Polyangiaceae bacterium]
MSTDSPLQGFGHSHAHLGELTRELSRLLSDEGGADPSAQQKIAALASELRHELLEHFANEEEGLFPLIRRHFPGQGRAVDQLQAAHDVICGTLVRFSFLAEREGELSSDARLAFARFEAAYGNHSRAEAELLDEFSRVLTPEQQTELEALLRDLS